MQRCNYSFNSKSRSSLLYSVLLQNRPISVTCTKKLFCHSDNIKFDVSFNQITLPLLSLTSYPIPIPQEIMNDLLIMYDLYIHPHFRYLLNCSFHCNRLECLPSKNSATDNTITNNVDYAIPEIDELISVTASQVIRTVTF